MHEGQSLVVPIADHPRGFQHVPQHPRKEHPVHRRKHLGNVLLHQQQQQQRKPAGKRREHDQVTHVVIFLRQGDMSSAMLPCSNSNSKDNTMNRACCHLFYGKCGCLLPNHVSNNKKKTAAAVKTVGQLKAKKQEAFPATAPSKQALAYTVFQPPPRAVPRTEW